MVEGIILLWHNGDTKQGIESLVALLLLAIGQVQ